jgi:hypothetical protein
MPKPSNVTDAELTACNVAADDLLMEMQDYIARIENGYIDQIERPIATARAFALIAKTASDLTLKLLMRAEIQQQHAALETLRKAASE